MTSKHFSPAVLDLDCEVETARIATRIRKVVYRDLRRKGAVVALSGGVDSSVCAALAAQALGPERVLALLLPERESSAASESLGNTVANQLGLTTLTERIGPTLDAIGCYRRRDEAIRSVFPKYGVGWKSKIVIARPPSGGLNFFKLVVQDPQGTLAEQRLPINEYLQIVAATSFKQRIRKTLEYFHADRLHYAVIGTPNRLEYDQGFFVKNGDGSADLKPIAHLYKTQVYQLARHFGLPSAVCDAPPTTDTYSLLQGQDEFYFALPYAQMDLVLWGHNHDCSAETVSTALGLPVKAVKTAYTDLEAKRRTTAYLHARPILIEPVVELS